MADLTYYDQIAEGYEELHMAEQLHKIEVIKTFFHPKEDEKVLDVGSGTGVTTEPWNCKRYGIDPAIKLLERARQKDVIEYKHAAAEEIPYEDNFFDYVISITAIQNFSDLNKGLLEMKRVGTGKFVISTLKRGSRVPIIEDEIKKVLGNFEKIEENLDFIYRIGF